MVILGPPIYNYDIKFVCQLNFFPANDYIIIIAFVDATIWLPEYTRRLYRSSTCILKFRVHYHGELIIVDLPYFIPLFPAMYILLHLQMQQFDFQNYIIIRNLEREYRDCIKSRRDKIGITRHIMMHQVLYNVHVTLFIGQLHNI